MSTKSFWVDVEVDLSDFDTDELLVELRDRDVTGQVVNADALGSMRQDMLRALWDKDEPRALSILRDYLCEVLNRATV